MTMVIHISTINSSINSLHVSLVQQTSVKISQFHPSIGLSTPTSGLRTPCIIRNFSIQCSAEGTKQMNLRTCKHCKSQFDPSLNHPQACRSHTAHFGGETRRKFESVYSGGTMNTPNSGKVTQYWHCCGSEDPFHPGCTAAPHSSYDD